MNIPSTLRLEDEDDLIAWSENSTSTSVTYQYCTALTPNYGLLTPVSPVSVSLNHDGDFSVFKDKFMLVGYEWYYIPSTAEITVDDYSVTITNTQRVTCSRECWAENKTKIARNKVIMQEETSAAGCYFDIPQNGTYTINYAPEIGGKDGQVVLMFSATDTAEYDYALPIDFKWLEESYIQVTSGIYYIPENCTITVEQGDGHKRVKFANTQKISVSSINDAPFTVKETSTKKDYRSIFSSEELEPNKTVIVEVYDSFYVDGTRIRGNLDDETVVFYVVNSDSDAEIQSKLQGKYYHGVDNGGRLLHIPADGKFKKTAVTHALSYKFDTSSGAVNDRPVFWSTFKSQAVNIYYWDSVTLDTETGQISGVGDPHLLHIDNKGNTSKYTYPTNTASNYSVLAGKYTTISNYNDGNGGEYSGWIKYTSSPYGFEGYQFDETSIYVKEYVRYTMVKSVPDQTATWYKLEVESNPLILDKALQHTSYIRSVGAIPYISTDIFREKEAEEGQQGSADTLPDGYASCWNADGSFNASYAASYAWGLTIAELNLFLSLLDEDELAALGEYLGGA